MKSIKTSIVIIGILAVVVFGIVFAVVNTTKNIDKPKNTMSTDVALKKLDTLYDKLKVNRPTPKKDPEFQPVDEYEEKIAVLPDISEYPFVVNPTTDDFLTIYSSEDKAEWFTDVANKFNQSGPTADGKPVSVCVRIIPSNISGDFIISGKYKPDVYAPPSRIDGEKIISQGVYANLIEEKLAGNVSGVIVTAQKYKELTTKYNTVTIKNIIDEVMGGRLALGYASPLSDGDGFNFIITLMMESDVNNPLSEESIEKLRGFQDKVPFIAYDSEQLKSSLNSGALDAIVLNSQAYEKSSSLKSSYEFVPFGIRQDNPIYSIGDASAIKKQITTQFVEFCKTAERQKSATDKGFNRFNDYSYTVNITGSTIMQIQEAYKKEKNGSSDITAIFVADISGSMEGAPLLNLKASLNRAIEVIDSNTNIGLITFSDDVNIAVPIAKFDNNQKSYFSNAVKYMSANGGTAMFDAIVVAEKMLMDVKERNPNTKVMLFVLTDGESNRGYNFKHIEELTRGIKIPIYTIGYNANIDILKELSDINEAATMNADSDNIIYRLESLFNSQT